ncbi:MAG: hypothetical protein ABI346_10210 [Candidatus Baltobacteraceae bacterium]
MFRLSKTLALTAVAFAATIALGRPAAAVPSGVDPGVVAAADAEMNALSGHKVGAFLDAFVPDPVLVDDSEPFFIEGRPRLREWFVDFWSGATSITLRHGPATDYALRGGRAYIAFRFKIQFTAPSGTFTANGVWAGTFARVSGDFWKISSLSIALLG